MLHVEIYAVNLPQFKMNSQNTQPKTPTLIYFDDMRTLINLCELYFTYTLPSVLCYLYLNIS